MQPFPLPEGTPDYAQAAQMVSAQQDILSYVIQSMAGYVDEQICTQQQLVDSVARTLMASACGRVSAGGRRIAPVADTLLTQAAAACSEDSIQINRAIDPLRRTADPAIALDPTVLPGTAPANAAMPPGCTPVVHVTQQQNLLYPSGSPDDVYQARSLAHAYSSTPGGLNAYFVVPSAQGPFLTGASVLVGYFDCPAGWRPVGAGASSSVLWLCPVNLPVPVPGDGGTPPPPPDTLPLQWYCGLNFQGTWTIFSLRGGVTPEVYAQYTTIRGPFATEAQAAQNCSPPGQTPAPPPTRTEQWFCVRSRTQSGEMQYAALPFRDILHIAETTWEYVSGPYVDQEQATKSCQAIEGNLSSGFSCPTWKIPAVQEWCSTNVCDTIDAITAAAQGATRLDLFELLNAGTLENMGPEGTWLGLIRKLPGVGTDWANIITIVLCGISSAVNAVVTTTGPSIPAFVTANGVGMVVGMLERWLGTGFTDLHRRADYWADYISPTIIPSVGEADAAFVRGFIDEKQWRCWVRANNVCDEPHRLIRDTQYLRPSWSQAERLYRTGVIGDEERDLYYHRSGIGIPGERAMFRELYTQYPGFDSVITFMVRDVFDPDAVTNGGLDAEFDIKYTADAERLGNIAGLSRDLAKLYWMAHWRQPSTTELYTMLHRLRPGVVPDHLVVTHDAVARQLGINDVAPAWREKLMEISYHSVSIRQARQFYQNGVIDKDGVEGIYLNQGYIPEQAKLAAENERIVKRRALAQLFKGWTPAATANAYASGQMTIQEAHSRMEYLGASKDQIDQLTRRATVERNAKLQLRAQSKAITSSWSVILKAYNTGSVTRDQAVQFLTQHGWSDASAQLALNAEDVRSRQSVVSQAIKTIRSSYLSAEIGLAAAANQLAAIGLAPPRIAELTKTWQLQLSGKRRVLSGQQALRLFREGLISLTEVQTRLNLLGWRNPDLTYQVQEAINARNAAAAKVAAAAAKAQSVAAAQLAREVKAQQALVAATQRKLCGMVPVSRMVKWYGLRYVEMPWFLDRLNTCGYTQDAITGYVDEAIAAREKADAARDKAASKSSTSNGAAPA
jgi:hypothetical protein